MDFLRFLSNISIWNVLGFLGNMFIRTIIIGGFIIFVYTMIRLLLDKKIVIKTILKIFLVCYIIICALATNYYGKNLKPRLSKYGYVDKKYLDDRLKRLNDAIKANPQDANNYFSRGMVYANNFYFNQALDDFKKALSLNPNLPIANNYVCYIYINKRQFDKAEEYCQRAIKQSPNFSKPYFNLARIYQHRKNFDKAVEQITKAIDLERNFYEGYILRSEFFYNKGEYIKAIDDLKKAIELNAPDKNYLQESIKRIQRKLNLQEQFKP